VSAAASSTAPSFTSTAASSFGVPGLAGRMQRKVCLRCGRGVYFFGDKFGGGGLQLHGALLNDRLGNRCDIIVEKQVICTCCLSEWIY
jgi:hypothetical protein